MTSNSNINNPRNFIEIEVIWIIKLIQLLLLTLLILNLFVFAAIVNEKLYFKGLSNLRLCMHLLVANVCRHYRKAVNTMSRRHDGICKTAIGRVTILYRYLNCQTQ